LRFLSVADDNRSSFPIFNARKIHRFSNLGKLIENPPLGLPCILNAIRKKYGIELGVTARMIRRLNQKKIRKQKINPKFQEKLSSEFFLDINNLSLLLGKKLWEL
jgi:hypothetical protein